VLIAATVVLLLIALLAVPVVMSYRLSWRQSLRGQLRLQWLFGLVRFSIPLQRAEGDHGAAPAKRQPRGKAAGRQSNPIAALRQADFRQRCLRFAREVWHAIHKTDLRLRLRIGLGDPADTGRLWAIVGPVSGYLGGYRHAAIEIEPEFIDAVFELDSSGSIRVIPLQLIYLTLALLLSPAIWRGVRTMRAAG